MHLHSQWNCLLMDMEWSASDLWWGNSLTAIGVQWSMGAVSLVWSKVRYGAEQSMVQCSRCEAVHMKCHLWWKWWLRCRCPVSIVCQVWNIGYLCCSCLGFLALSAFGILWGVGGWLWQWHIGSWFSGSGSNLSLLSLSSVEWLVTYMVGSI